MILNYYEPMIQKPITKGAEIMDNQKVYTVQEVAEILKVSAYTVQEKLRKGIIPGMKIGKFWRITENQLKQFLEKQSS